MTYKRMDVERKPWPGDDGWREISIAELIATVDGGRSYDEKLAPHPMLIDGSWLFPDPDRFA